MWGRRADKRAGHTTLCAIFAVAAGLSLAGCSDVDDALFGDQPTVADAAPAGAFNDNGGDAGSGLAGTLPGSDAVSGPITGPMATITPVSIDPGADTGTAVSKTIQSLRGNLSGIETRLASNAQRLADLRNSGAASSTAYHESKARITARLQVGTTRGNPELVREWNTAQSSLDQLAGNINGLNALGTALANDASSTHFILDQIAATYNVSGAVDEDHRQLAVLEDETNQTIVLLDRLVKEVSDDVQRQTAYVGNERANLTTLSASIKNGELYGAGFAAPLATSMAGTSTGTSMAYGGTPLVVIRFDRPNVDYQQILYAALNQALQSRPSAGFEIVGVSPTRGTAATVELAQTAAKRHAQEVVQSMSDMGVPSTRMAVASSTDPGAASSEVRVFVR